ncbi:MAG: hypothetical protein A2Y33_01755 [Spirochaetes bacterium GWF1_51_8]|nr:MAG: hypothetical protein A2Y33_01755 [Spirochaetes bacterium GWF1_51_8]
MKSNSDNSVPVPKRLASVDHYRGLALLLMILVNTASGFTAIPLWMKHAQWDGFTFADAIAPMFLFAIGLTAGISFTRRGEKDGIPKTVLHLIIRNLLLIGFGVAGTLVTGKPLLGGEEILTLIGAAGILCIPFWLIPSWIRAGIGLLLLGLFAVLNTGALAPAVMLYAGSGLGGWAALPMWMSVILFASWAGERFRADKAKTVTVMMSAIAAIFVLAGAAGHSAVPINKHLVSFSYILLSTGIALGVYTIFYRLFDFGKSETAILASPGKNPLLIYITSSVAGILFPGGLPLVWCIGAVLLNMGFHIALGIVLDRKKVYLKL